MANRRTADATTMARHLIAAAERRGDVAPADSQALVAVFAADLGARSERATNYLKPLRRTAQIGESTVKGATTIERDGTVYTATYAIGEEGDPRWEIPIDILVDAPASVLRSMLEVTPEAANLVIRLEDKRQFTFLPTRMVGPDVLSGRGRFLDSPE